MVRQLITVEGVDRSFGPVDVLRDVNLIVNDGDRIGIVGPNGAGKTTLLNTISDQLQDVGEIEFAPGLRIAYLTQIRDLESDRTIEEELSRKGRQFQELEEEIAAIEAQMVDPAFYEGDWEPVMERYTQLQQTLAQSGGGNVAGIAKAILVRLGLDKHPMDMQVSALSGGEKAKLALARQLVGLAGVDVIFLDEPTNHLDIQTTEWLEDFLRDFRGAQLIVSHDRYFLDQVCNRVIEIQDLHAWPYTGNYTRYITQKERFEASLSDQIATTEKKIKSTQGAMQQMKRANKYDKSISAKHKMIERLQQDLKALKTRVPRKRKPLRLRFEAVDKASMDMVDFKGATKRFDGLDRAILDNQDLEIRKGDRIGIVGGNGQGKTTLLKMIVGDEALTSGKLEVSPGVIIGYFHQDHATLDFDLNPVQQIEALRPDLEYGDIRAALGRFQFSSDQVTTPLKALSGGERARVALLKLLLEDNNLLLMDEPTNHLDMESKDTLEEALTSYQGSLVTVSHDRWFLDQVVNRIWEVEEGQVKVYYGNYTDYVRAKKGLPPLTDEEREELAKGDGEEQD
ncbi:MAG: ABC-F family ATP-binding cassette domain-containing protein [archaeon]|nr:ABC-F family ATP-binding cassette domain-containing protein [archaeon]